MIELKSGEYNSAKILSETLEDYSFFQVFDEYSNEELIEILKGNFKMQEFKIADVVKRTKKYFDKPEYQLGHMFRIADVYDDTVRDEKGMLHRKSEIEKVDEFEKEEFEKWEQIQEGDILIHQLGYGTEFVQFVKREGKNVTYKRDIESDEVIRDSYIYFKKYKFE